MILSKIIGQQQRALLSHHLHQRTRFSNALDQLTELYLISPSKFTSALRKVDGCALFNEEHIDRIIFERSKRFVTKNWMQSHRRKQPHW